MDLINSIQFRVDENFRTATELCRKERYILSGNSLKGSNIKHKKRKIHAAGKKDAGGDEKLFFYLALS
jgi:hypothetical protein